MHLSPRTVFLTLLLAGPALSFAGASLAASSAHEHGSTAPGLHLNAGAKWATDAPLRKAMGALKGAMQAALPQIHDNTLEAAQYDQLVVRINDEVAYMIEHCQLEPAADAQLHGVIAELLAGATSMAGKTPAVTRREGAVRVLGALDSYARYFVDASFEPIQH